MDKGKGKKMKRVIVGINVILLVSIFFLLWISKGEEESALPESLSSEPDRNLSFRDIPGEYYVKQDKKTVLRLNENGEYSLSFNVCHGYLTLTGKYEVIGNRLRLFHTDSDLDYEDLKNNPDISFVILDDETVRLEEDLVCVFQDTLFER